METTVLSFCNQKGGVGKTSTTALVSYNLAKQGYKVLDIDFDPQANLTSLMVLTKIKRNKGTNSDDITVKSLMNAIKTNRDLNEIKINILPNLDLIPTSAGFSLYGRFLDSEFQTEEEKVTYFSKLIEKYFKGKYDFIFLDVPPTFGLSNDSAFYACDQLMIVLQTQALALEGAEVLVPYIQKNLIDSFDAKVDILGIVPVLSKRGAKVDNVILKSAKEKFGEETLFKTKIHAMERVKRMYMTGITDNPRDTWDKRTHKPFIEVGKEMIARLNKE